MPYERGAYRFPAEWEPHAATWLGWPHNGRDWPGKFAAIPWVYGEIVRKIVEAEDAHILVNSPAQEARAWRVLEKVGIPSERVRFFRWPSDRGWTRDFGPLCVRDGHRDEALAVVDTHFNAWARYPTFKRDARLARRAAKALELPLVSCEHLGLPVVLEGGALDFNGRGTVLTTEECLLDPDVQVRNPGFTKADYEAVFAEWFGARNTIWLGHGIAGDDTHGHVDDLCRFVDERTIALIQEDDPADANYRALRENRERLEDARLEDGSKPEVVYLPMPRPIYFGEQRLPASYANFYISNASVIVPTFNDENDRKALGILGELFPHRSVVGIHAVDLVLGFGTLHCLTQQFPKA
ncbi:MAG: hypothetical protein AMXMBFR7_53200 [Planctomycetota bacterium]